MAPVIHALGDSGLTITLAENSSSDATRFSRETAERLRQARISHVEEVIAAYTAVTVFYDALHVSFDEIKKSVSSVLADSAGSTPIQLHPRRHVIPVTYDGADLESVAEKTGLTRDQVIEIHCARTYDVDLLGFVPGWAYLSELDPRLQLPRRERPRPKVSAGAVAIAAGMTGIYPFDTPGGWHLLGSSTAVMFDPRRAQPSLLKPGDTVKFEPAP
jgi:KipI family sensor histidine kinase inhibitor